ncbi:hypothetical protein I3I95_07415 [bacterium]|nr:hypothetical protein [bacterium]
MSVEESLSATVSEHAGGADADADAGGASASRIAPAAGISTSELEELDEVVSLQIRH